MGFNGEILVGRDDTFTDALSQFWTWEEEVVTTWPLHDDWQAIHVHSPAEPDELKDLVELASGPILACLLFEGTTGHTRGVGTAGRWEAWLNSGTAAHLRAWKTVDKQIDRILYPREPQTTTSESSSARRNSTPNDPPLLVPRPHRRQTRVSMLIPKTSRESLARLGAHPPSKDSSHS